MVVSDAARAGWSVAAPTCRQTSSACRRGSGPLPVAVSAGRAVLPGQARLGRPRDDRAGAAGRTAPRRRELRRPSWRWWRREQGLPQVASRLSSRRGGIPTRCVPSGRAPTAREPDRPAVGGRRCHDVPGAPQRNGQTAELDHEAADGAEGASQRLKSTVRGVAAGPVRCPASALGLGRFTSWEAWPAQASPGSTTTRAHGAGELRRGPPCRQADGAYVRGNGGCRARDERRERRRA